MLCINFRLNVIEYIDYELKLSVLVCMWQTQIFKQKSCYQKVLVTLVVVWLCGMIYITSVIPFFATLFVDSNLTWWFYYLFVIDRGTLSCWVKMSYLDCKEDKKDGGKGGW